MTVYNLISVVFPRHQHDSECVIWYGVCVCTTSRSSGVTSSVEDFECEPPATQPKDEDSVNIQPDDRLLLEDQESAVWLFSLGLNGFTPGCSGFPLNFGIPKHAAFISKATGSQTITPSISPDVLKVRWSGGWLRSRTRELLSVRWMPLMELSHGEYFDITSQNCCCGKHRGQMEARRPVASAMVKVGSPASVFAVRSFLTPWARTGLHRVAPVSFSICTLKKS